MRAGDITRISVFRTLGGKSYGVTLRNDDAAASEYPIEEVHKDKAVAVALAIWEVAGRSPELTIDC